MTTNMENKESSHDSGYVEEHVDYSAELKVSNHSQKAENKSKQEMKRIAERLGSSGLQDELTESEDIPRRNHNRSSDFIYTGNSGRIDADPEEVTSWDTAKYKFNQVRQFCGEIVNDEKVQYAIVVCIFINAAMMGIATYGFIKENKLASQTFQYADLIFLIIFTIELLLQAIYHGPRMLLDGWLVFDLIVVTLSWVAVGPASCPSESRRILDEVADVPCKEGALRNAQLFRAFRIFRALRLVTRIKTMKDLIVAIFAVMPRMLAIFLMLLLIFYIFAVMFTQLYSKVLWTAETAETPEDIGQPVIYFRTLDQSMLTLFQLMTMDEWANVVRALQGADPTNRLAWFYIIFFIVVSGFIMVNLIVAVICDAIGSLSDSDKEKLQGRYDSEGSSMNLGEQIDEIEESIASLTRTQAKTLITLEYLMEQLKKEKKSGSQQKQPAEEKMQGGNDQSTNTNKKPPATDSNLMMNRLKSLGLSKRKNFTSTQESDKTLSRAKASEFAKSIRKLEQQKLRESGSNFANARLAQSVRNLRDIRQQEDEGFRSEGFLASGSLKSEEIVPLSEKKNSEWK